MKAQRLVRDWMTPDPVTATPKTSVPEAYQMMKENQIRRLPIMDDGKLVGLVTRGDVRGAQASEATSLSVWELNYLLGKLQLAEVMSKKVIVVTPETSMHEAAEIMLENKIAGLPVMEGSKLVGIITESDIFRMLVEHWEPQASALEGQGAAIR